MAPLKRGAFFIYRCDIYIKIIRMKKVIRLTEKELNDIVYSTTRQMLNEGAGADMVSGIGNIVGGLMGLIGGKKLTEFERNHPKLTRILTAMGMTPEANKINDRKNNFKRLIIRMVTEKYGVTLENLCEDFNNELIEMINGERGSRKRFTEIDEEGDAIPVSSVFYNECVRIINTSCDFVNEWSYVQNQRLVKSKFLPRNRRYSSSEYEVDKERTRDVFERRARVLDDKFNKFKRCVTDCYNEIKSNFQSSRYLDQDIVYDIVSEYANDFNYIAQMYYKLKYDWLARTVRV